MTLATPPRLDALAPPRPALPASHHPLPRSTRRELLLLIAGWICLAAAFSFYSWKIVRIGIDVRNGFWVYWLPNHFLGDLDNAYQQGNFALERAKFLARQQGRPWNH
jgi:hypothetical protein